MARLWAALGVAALALRCSLALRNPRSAQELSTEYGPLPSGVEWLDQTSALSPRFEELMAGGQLWTALILATHFNLNNAGATLPVGEAAEVRTPFPAASSASESPAWSSAPVLLEKFGTKFCAVHLWLGHGEGGDGAIYVTFTPARQGMGDLLTLDHLRRIYGGSNAAASEEDGLTMSAYLKRKFDRMWSEHGLEAVLQRFVTAPEHRGRKIIFTGVSHGAALTQVASYRFARKLPEWVGEDQAESVDWAAVSWNSYLWTNSVGATAVRDTVGDHLLNVVLTQRQHKTLDRYMDSVSGYGFDQNFVPLPGTILLEAGCNREPGAQAKGDEEICGDFLACDSEQKCPPPTFLGKDFATHIMKLHRAPRIKAAMKRATRKARARAADDE